MEKNMGCCDDPTEPVKFNRTDLLRAQEQYGNLLRDLFTDNPEKLMLKQLNGTSSYLRELAALNAHFNSVKKQAIKLLEKESLSVLHRIAEQQTDNELVKCAQQRIEELNNPHSFLGDLFKGTN